MLITTMFIIAALSAACGGDDDGETTNNKAADAAAKADSADTVAKADSTPSTGTLDLGIASNYVVNIQGKARLQALHDMGIRRVNLYYTWHEFETTKPDDRTDLKQVDDTIAIIKSLGMRASLIIEVTTTDCKKTEDANCWLQGNPGDFPSFPSHIPFKGWDQEPTISAMAAFAKKLATRWSPDVVTHILIGNEMDLFLRRDYTGLKSADNVAAFGKGHLPGGSYGRSGGARGLPAGRCDMDLSQRFCHGCQADGVALPGRLPA